jgi:DtxR family Mn-dependent transcriptional regulator
MTYSEENYLKTIFHLTVVSNSEVSTNSIAEMMETKASSVTDMIKKLAEKDLVNYKKYQGVSLTNKGKLAAKMIVRRHRLWEVFLVENLNFSWDEVHEVAEQLEHIKSEKLISELDRFLGYPKRDPHGDPIPDDQGNFKILNKVLLSELKKGESGIFVGVKDSSVAFLQFLDKRNIGLGDEIKIIEREPFDQSVLIKINEQELRVSHLISGNIFIKIT